MPRMVWSFAIVGMVTLGVPAARGEDPPKRKVVAGKHYQAGGIHRALFGADYRDLWAMPVEVPVLDLQHYAGGLRPVRRVGGQETKGLAMKGADGRDYTFRAIDKDPTSILPEELQDTWARGLVQRWRLVEALIKEGQKSGEFRQSADAAVTARMILSALLTRPRPSGVNATV